MHFNPIPHGLWYDVITQAWAIMTHVIFKAVSSAKIPLNADMNKVFHLCYSFHESSFYHFEQTFCQKRTCKRFFRGFWLHLETSKLLNVPKMQQNILRGVHLNFFHLAFKYNFCILWNVYYKKPNKVASIL